MTLEPLALLGLMRVRHPAARDQRGSFERLWCASTLALGGVDFVPVQASLSRNPRRGTLRGLHWQAAPHTEAKLVGVLRGAVWDVVVDLRKESPTRGHWLGLELDGDAGDALYIPPGFAHGFITLRDDTELMYLIDTPHVPDAVRGARYDDRAFGIDWPLAPAVISDRDRLWPDWALPHDAWIEDPARPATAGTDW